MYWLALIALLFAAVFDLKAREIPNTIPVLLLVLALAAKALGLHPVPLGEIALGVGGAACVSIALFARGGLGGGDVKLLIALGAALGIRALLPFALVTAIVGGAVALVARRRGEAELPYAPVMLAGLLLLLPAAWIAR